MNNLKIDPEKCQILVLSYDGFSDVWPVFFDCFFQYWPDCPFEINLLTNFLEYPDTRVKSLKIGMDEGWSDGVIKALSKIDTERVFFFYEDAFLNKPVDSESVLKFFDWAIMNDSDCLRLRPSPPPKKRIDDLVGLILKGAMYRISMFLSVFKKATLLELLNEKENAWEFEFMGSDRSDEFEKFHCVYKNVISYDHAIVKGLWTNEVLPIIEKHKINPLIRGTFKDSKIDRGLQKIIDISFRFIPSKYERPVYFFLRKIYFAIK